MYLTVNVNVEIITYIFRLECDVFLGSFQSCKIQVISARGGSAQTEERLTELDTAAAGARR